ncbi:hypothetical protein IFM46972_06733 [Aspergillus udagawae]|uniref:Uncharacterized protein n=1 Tax=Aspergillus udagawae TaxID=91492 RepID=A0A8H3P321_9EURO|nr:hypothetical protein IFM46972_06733 [Aspergillus udagawae]
MPNSAMAVIYSDYSVSARQNYITTNNAWAMPVAPAPSFLVVLPFLAWRLGAKKGMSCHLFQPLSSLTCPLIPIAPQIFNQHL